MTSKRNLVLLLILALLPKKIFSSNDPSSVVEDADRHVSVMTSTNLNTSSTISRSSISSDDTSICQGEYGVDVSWPIQHGSVSINFPWLPHNVDPEHHPVPVEYKGMPIQPLGDRQTVYDTFMKGCRDLYQDRQFMCDQTELNRVKQSLTQPATMTNYTDLGFKKIRTPEPIFTLIKEFWETNRHLQKPEQWAAGYTYTNHWEVNSTMVSVDDVSLTGGGNALKQQILQMAAGVVEQWTGKHSVPTSLYGVRVYKTGAILAPHVDRLPLVSSMIINVDQDVDDEWPLEVYGHDGKVYNITMQPGEMILYESHSIVHGRPFALNGRFYANIFAHFEPANPASLAAREGNLEALKRYGQVAMTHSNTNINDKSQDEKQQQHLFYEKDVNGWEPMHEAARGGYVDIIVYLLTQKGVDINSPTYNHQTPLDIAIQFPSSSSNHPVIQKLKELGGYRFSDLDWETYSTEETTTRKFDNGSDLENEL